MQKTKAASEMEDLTRMKWLTYDQSKVDRGVVDETSSLKLWGYIAWNRRIGDRRSDD